ncbi:hypothetical protein PQX77_009071 [Marasmius sp. AFHP31]|nr:hypothetical protein PQX77_009071 [Marasmius sp. AFHP31]
MDENPPTSAQYFVTTWCWEVGTQACTLKTVGVIVRLCALFLTYGIHLVLFVVCISILRRHRHGRFRLHCLLVTALFVLATCGIALETANATLSVYDENILDSIPMMKYKVNLSSIWPSRSALEKLVGPQAPSPEDMWNQIFLLKSYESKLDYAMQAMIVTSNLVTDSILIWRCYIIWGSRWRVVSLPTLLCLVNNGYLNIFYSTDFSDRLRSQGFTELWGSDDKSKAHVALLLCFSCGSLLSNLLLTVLIAGRVLHISQQCPRLNHRPMTRMYRTVIHASVESGVLYPMSLFAYVVLLLVQYASPLPLILIPEGVYSTIPVVHSCLISMMVSTSTAALPGSIPNQNTQGIASTLIVVRTALGIAINDEKSFRATVLGEGDGGNRETRGIIDSVLDIRKPDESVKPHDEERAEGSEDAQKIEESRE